METIVWGKIGSSLIFKCRLAEHSTFKSIFSSSLPGTYLNQRLVMTCRLSRVVTSFTKHLFITQCSWFQYLSPLMPTCTFASAINLSFVLCKKNKKNHACTYFIFHKLSQKSLQTRETTVYVQIYEILTGRLSISSNTCIYSFIVQNELSFLQNRIK